MSKLTECPRCKKMALGMHTCTPQKPTEPQGMPKSLASKMADLEEGCSVEAGGMSTEDFAKHVQELERQKPAESLKEFPIMRDGKTPGFKIPWHIAELAYDVYRMSFGNNQSLERIAERGGFGANEMDMFLPNWRELIKPDSAEVKLKECAFCGSSDLKLSGPVNDPPDNDILLNSWNIYCKQCHAVGPSLGEENQAIAAWNTRALRAGVEHFVELLKANLERWDKPLLFLREINTSIDMVLNENI